MKPLNFIKVNSPTKGYYYVYHGKTTDDYRALALLAMAFTGLAVIFSLLIPQNTQMISPESKLQPVINRVYAAEPTPEPTPTLKPMSDRTIGCINNYPGITTKIINTYGDEWQEMADIICRESSFNQYAINPTSGACGLAQALPCEKMGCSLDDAQCQLNWQKIYLLERYGSVEATLEWHDSHGWY